MIFERSLSGKKPPDDIKLNAKFNELKVRTEKIFKIKKTKLIFVWSVLIEKPIFDMLLTIAKKFTENSLLKLKNKRNISTIIVRYTIKWRSS